MRGSKRCPAPVESTTALASGASSFYFRQFRVAALKKQNHRRDSEQGCHAGNAHDFHYCHAILTRSRIIVIAIEQQLLDRAPNLVFRRLDQPETQVARGVVDTVKVT